MLSTTDILRKVQALISTAEDPATPPESAADFRGKAEELMRKYRIEEEQLIAADPTSVEPIREEFDVCARGNPFSTYYGAMFRWCAEHAGARVHLYYGVQANGARGLRGSIVGYPTDVRIALYLFTAARLVFAEHLEPEIKPELSDAENVYRLRRAGIERNRIANLLWGASVSSAGAHAHGKVGRLYKEACAARGEDPAVSGRSVNAKTYREAYAREFAWRFFDRLAEARRYADGIGGALVLHGRSDRVDEAFFGHFPEYRPSTEVATPGDAKPAKPRKVTKAERTRIEREHYSPAALAGQTAGIRAADAVEIARTEQAKRLDEGEEGQLIRVIRGELES